MSQAETKSGFKSGYVAIVGKPNVGKSTLLNNLLSFKISAVTHKAQTTRHQIRGILNGDDYQIIFLDTPGLLAPKYRLQETMLAAAHRSLQEADLSLFLIQADAGQNKADFKFLEECAEHARKLVLVINKIDLVPKEELLPLIQFFHETGKVEQIIPVSALKDDGLDLLRDEIVKYLRAGVPFYSREHVTDHPERFLVAELIREQIFLRFADEIPYSTTVEIEEFKERKKSKDYVRACIYVERTSQKGILIGKKGNALKKIGSDARVEIQEVLGREVFLELWVRVKEKWRESEILLKEFGYSK